MQNAVQNSFEFLFGNFTRGWEIGKEHKNIHNEKPHAQLFCQMKIIIDG